MQIVSINLTQPTSLPDTYLSGVQSTLSFFIDVPPPKADLAECVTEILYGSKQTRIHNPTDAERAHMVQLVRQHIATGSPIDVLTMWGATKAYASDNGRQTADILDFAGLQRIGCLAARVATQYAPGLRVRIILEDVTRMLRASHNDYALHEAMDCYERTLNRMVDTLGLSDTISMLTESELMHENKIDFDTYAAMAKSNADAFYRFWFDGELQGAFVPTLPAWKDVEHLGWSGFIGEKMWDYYVSRSKGEHPELDQYASARSVCDYFGIVLARKQTGSLRMDGNGVNPIKLSLAPHPPGVDEKMHLGRIELKVKNTKNAHTLAPWVGFGAMKETSPGTYDFAFFGLREYRAIASKLKPVNVTAEWHEPLGSGKEGEGMAIAIHQATFRADVLPLEQ